ncbi:DinB family protein, partial [Sphingomonas sp.]|uniref:DinB family protein n=1 Tax=Sphingomonas sp. TaxID=28214 RepID=UPI0025FEFAA4
MFATRKLTLGLAAPLTDADASLQPFTEASPAKWHLAHSTWFFETFVLRDHVPGYRPFDQDWAYLFNSYYEGEGARHPRPRRGMLSRPSLDEIRHYRAHVDAAVADALPELPPVVLERLELGLHHEQQHQ